MTFDQQAFGEKQLSLPFKENTYDITSRIIHMDKEFQTKMKEIVKGKRAIEIGCGYNGGFALELLWLGVNSYEGVDPFNCPDIDEFMEGGNNTYGELQKQWRKKIKFIHQDGVSFLESIADGSDLVIVSSGIMETDIIIDPEYQQQMVLQIARLANPSKASSIHTVDPFFAELFLQNGLKLEYSKEIPSNGFVFGMYSKN